MGKRARLKRLKRQKELDRRTAASDEAGTSPTGSTFLTFTPGTRPPKIRFDSLVTTSTNLVVGHDHTPLDIRGSIVQTPQAGPGSGHVRNLVIGGVDDCPRCQRMLEDARRRSRNPEIFSD